MRKSYYGCFVVVAMALVTIAIFGLHWAWKYYGLPEWPDRKEYKTIEERAENALAFVERHNMNEHYALFLDYGIPSGTPPSICMGFSEEEDCDQGLCDARNGRRQYGS